MEPRRLWTLVHVDPSAPFVPEGFVPPAGLVTDALVLEPLGPRHNEAEWPFDHVVYAPRAA